MNLVANFIGTFAFNSGLLMVTFAPLYVHRFPHVVKLDVTPFVPLSNTTVDIAVHFPFTRSILGLDVITGNGPNAHATAAVSFTVRSCNDVDLGSCDVGDFFALPPFQSPVICWTPECS